MLHPFLCPEQFSKNLPVLGLRKITVIIKAVVEAVELGCVEFAFGFSVEHSFEPVQSLAS
jgi:hypothetical protein